MSDFSNDTRRKKAILLEVDKTIRACPDPPLTHEELRNTILKAMVYGCKLALECPTPFRISRILREILQEETDEK